MSRGTDERRFKFSPAQPLINRVKEQLTLITPLNRYRLVVPVTTNGRLGYADAHLLTNIGVMGYTTAIVARLINEIFPKGFFVLVLGNSVPEVLGPIQNSMGMDSQHWNDSVAVIYAEQHHSSSDEIMELFALACTLFPIPTTFSAAAAEIFPPPVRERTSR